MEKFDENRVIEFRENLKRLDASFPGLEILNNKQTCSFLGITDKTLKKRFGKLRVDALKGYPKTTIAKMMIGVV